MTYFALLAGLRAAAPVEQHVCNLLGFLMWSTATEADFHGGSTVSALCLLAAQLLLQPSCFKRLQFLHESGGLSQEEEEEGGSHAIEQLAKNVVVANALLQTKSLVVMENRS